ncbi:hypothetical protein P3T76_014210 [Phytophthora citrophthora]|uniref:RxLR effector protein n=1 Tax=Phytophthora citrophthora TaxID=4793 RepID=A0AAD9G242_9STRA|nr:hypothetical protein P3T76_014210 [Phytophthora citrophthora]
MRFSYLLLVAAAALLATANAIEADAGTRSLRTYNTHHDSEERGFSYKFDVNKLDDVFNSLPKQFQNMYEKPSYLRQRLKNWKTVYGTPKKAAEYMRNQGLNDQAIEQFNSAFRKYLRHKRGN